MIGPKYGAIPIVHDTGGIHDTITALDVNANTENGFLFCIDQGTDLRAPIHNALNFWWLPTEQKQRHIIRIMQQSEVAFSHAKNAENYFPVYEAMLDRPLVSKNRLTDRPISP